MNTKQTILLTGGRAPAALDLARRFASRGHRVIVAESQKYFLARSSRAVSKAFHVHSPHLETQQFIADLRNIVIAEKVDHLIPVCEEAFYVSRGRANLDPLCKVWTDLPDQLHVLHSKWLFNQRVQALGWKAPKTWLLTSQEELSDLLKRWGQNKLVLKPVYSRFAAKTRIGFANEFITLPVITPMQPWVAQECIDGVEICTYSVADRGKLKAHSSYSHEFTAGRGAGISFESVDDPEILTWVQQFVSATQYTGQIAFDFIRNSRGELYPLECNPRATSGVHLFDAEGLENTFLNSIVKRVEPQIDAGKVGLAMMLYGLSSVQSFHRLHLWVQTMRKAREVIFSWRDPVPAFEQWLSLFAFWRMSLKKQVSLLEASTLDIEWNGT